MRETLRLSMTYLHTWLGLVLGFVLMVVFFFGSLSVFDREIDRWSVPETRVQSAPFPSFDQYIRPLIAQVSPDPHSIEHTAAEVVGALPAPEKMKPSDMGVYTNHRDPLVRMYVAFDVPNKPRDPLLDHVHVYGYASIDPQTGWRLPRVLQDRLALGTGFFFPLHYMLHLEWKNLGSWLVGLAGMAMLVALVTGIIMHRRIFREFFTFRPGKSPLRSTLDLHNMSGVLALPFLFLISLSGLLIFAYIYFPSSTALMKPLMEVQEQVEAARTGLAAEPSGKPGGLASVDAMVAEAKAKWAGNGVPGEVGAIYITHLGDAESYVSISRDSVDRVATPETLHFSAVSGRLIYEDPPASAIEAVDGFLYGLHFQFFRHWPLRWLLFVGGLMGCACIATGFLFFVEKRKRKLMAGGLAGMRIVDALAVASVTGMLLATCAMLLANRILPVQMAGHDEWQVRVFWFAWIASLFHAGLRARSASGDTNSAWRSQCWATAGLALAAVLANWVTTGDHLLATISKGYWPVAGVDLVLLFGAAIAALVARRLGQKAANARLAQSSAVPGRTEQAAHV